MAGSSYLRCELIAALSVSSAAALMPEKSVSAETNVALSRGEASAFADADIFGDALIPAVS